MEPGRSYALALSGELFNAKALLSTVPRTSLTFSGSAEGEGTDLATLRSTVALDLETSSVDTVQVDSARVRLRASGGLATFDTLGIWGPTSVIAAAGTLGLTESQE